MSSIRCKKCGRFLPDSKEVVPCSICGPVGRLISVSARVEGRVRAFVGFRIVNKLERKKPVVEAIHRLEVQKSTGRVVEKKRVIDRRSDTYYEEVIDDITRVVLHRCEEPLSSHVGHGSAKTKKG